MNKAHDMLMKVVLAGAKNNFTVINTPEFNEALHFFKQREEALDEIKKVLQKARVAVEVGFISKEEQEEFAEIIDQALERVK